MLYGKGRWAIKQCILYERGWVGHEVMCPMGGWVCHQVICPMGGRAGTMVCGKMC